MMAWQLIKRRGIFIKINDGDELESFLSVWCLIIYIISEERCWMMGDEVNWRI